MRILITGAAGFIGADLSQKLLDQGHSVIGVDDFNDYYDVTLKRDRIKEIQTTNKQYQVVELDICERVATSELFEKNNFDVVIHLAAQAGVRLSLIHI